MKPIITLLLFTINILIINAQQVPQHLDFTELGLSFDMPDGWQGEINGEVLIMGNHNIAGLMVVFQNNSKNAHELKDLAMKGMSMQGADLNPVSEFTIINDHRIEGIYQGFFYKNQVKCYAIGLINGLGTGVNILMISKTNEFTNVQKSEAYKLASSVKFYQARETQATIHWKNKIVGTQLKYLSTQSSTDSGGGSTGMSFRTEIDLCTNGRFYFYTNSSASFSTANAGETVGFGSGNSRGEYEGTYTIYSVGNYSFLVLTSTDNIIYEYDLSTNNEGHIYLDDTRYFVTDSDNCN